jgi:hypothetical protein
MSSAGQVGQAKKAAFLEAYSKLGTITHAAKAAGVPRSSHYEWLQTDPEYRKAYDDAEQQAIEGLEREARRRAIEGTEEPVFHQGQIVGGVRKYSDTLLIFLLKGARPERYRERVDMTVDIRREAERVAAEAGLDPDAVLAEAERIVRASSA